jgi:anhydro-N-acetylmuramic acid kinase
MIVIGLMSGTSADGTDAAVVDLDGAPPSLRWRLLAHIQVPHPPALRQQIFAAFRPETGNAAALCRLNFALGHTFAHAALEAARTAGLAPEQIDLIGSHGQTVWHIPAGEDASTLQLGAAALIAEETGIPTVSNFRARDMAAGGQGAPLVAYVDTLLFSHPTLARAVQNIGGIANVTYLPPGDEQSAGGPFAFDTGPGNMLIDYAAARATAGAWLCDRDGALASRGRVDASLLAELLADPYLRQPPPKTTGRERFGEQYGSQVWAQGIARGLNGADIVATLTAFTAASIARAYTDFLPRLPDEVIVSGGGTRNPALLAMLRAHLGAIPLRLSDELGLPGQAKEALAFAVLAYETWHGRPGNLPAATGARKAVVLGDLTPGRSEPAPQAALPDSESPTVSLTEARNPRTTQIDRVPALEMVRLINAEDARVPQAVASQLPYIAEAIERIAERMRRGGRLIYLGAGTSGRLAVLDAVECLPTFNIAPDRVIPLIAGGKDALTRAAEGDEDDAGAGARDLAGLDVSPLDSVVGIAASGRTPYVLGGLREAHKRGAYTVSLACNHPSPLAELTDLSIAPLVGPEVIAGSTRLKAGSAQKMVLNMLSTGIMIRLGKTYGNLMVDVRPTNAKLQARARHIVEEVCGLSPDEAAVLLDRCGEVKVAIVSHLGGLDPESARARLEAAGGVIRLALQQAG